MALLTIVTLALTAAPGATPRGGTADPTTFVPPGLLKKAEASPGSTMRVIVQTRGANAGLAKAAVARARAAASGNARGLLRQFTSVPAVSAELTGAQVARLLSDPDVFAITEDAVTRPTYSNSQLWVGGTEGNKSWSATAAGYTYPTIAIVDSGVEPRSDFGTRLLASQNLVSAGLNSPGDGYGHGTLVAGLAAGSAEGYAGVAPRAKIVSLDVLDDAGAGYTSDVIAACDWILANKAQYNIRVANFSLSAGFGASVMFDPLDRAVEKLWLNGVVVVASAGNYAVDGAASGVLYAPANDPFVITVGASDVNGTTGKSNDFPAPWSAWGHTYDGFFKPEIAAPGRKLKIGRASCRERV